MDENKTISFTAESTGGYVVEKSWSLNLAREFATDATEVGITWNNFKATDAGIVTPLGSSLSNLVTEDNLASTLSVTNKMAFDGASNGLADYVSGSPVYPIVAVNSGFQMADPTALTFSGADPDKYYQLYILTCVSTADSAITVTNGVQTISHNSSNNYPVDGDNRYSSASMIQLKNVRPDLTGSFDIEFERNGNYYISPINIILIQQSNVAKA